MPEKILLVDDNEHFLKLLRNYLEGFIIMECSSGEKAINVVTNDKGIDLVVLDIVMPGLNGFEVLKRIKEIKPGISVIILTGYSSNEVMIETLRSSADDFIDKDTDMNKIRDIIERVLDNRISQDTKIFGVKNKIERMKRMVERNYYKKISLKDASDMFCLSPKYLSRIFKQDTGIGFNDFKIRIKINKGKDLLNQTDSTIGQVAEKLGYNNTESFIKQFKKHTGFSPSRYRKQGIKSGFSAY